MNTINQMKNIIVLKDLPSNIIEEAFVILKNNKKIKVNDNAEKNTNIANNMEEEPEKYIVREAEMVINNYLSSTEKEYEIKSNRIKQIENKYKRLKKITILLGVIMAINTMIQLIFR